MLTEYFQGLFQSLGFSWGTSLVSGILSCKNWPLLSPQTLSSVSSLRESAGLHTIQKVEIVIGLTLFISHFSGTSILPCLMYGVLKISMLYLLFTLWLFQQRPKSCLLFLSLRSESLIITAFTNVFVSVSPPL